MTLKRPFPAYRGPEEHVFVCYAHTDAGIVYPEITALYEGNINIWYDEGIEVGQEWRGEIEDALEKASSLLFYHSAASVQSKHCIREVAYALNRDIPIVRVDLDGSELPRGLRLGLETEQAIDSAFYSRDEYAEKLLHALEGGVPSGPGDRQQRASEARSLNVDPRRSKTNPTIAVLPLRNLSPDQNKNYISDAISSEIWEQLTRITDLRVISMISSMRFQQSDLDVREIGQRLTAEYLIEGSTSWVDDVVRINTHLIETRTGTELWGTSLKKSITDPSDLFTLYDEICAEVDNALPTQIRGIASMARRQTRGTANIAAYNLLQQAQHDFWRTADPRSGLLLIEEAVKMDPGWATAHAELGIVHYSFAEVSQEPPKEYLDAARESLERALANDPNSGTAHVLKGMLLTRVEPDFRRAVEAFERAELLGVSTQDVARRSQDVLLTAGLYERGLDGARSVAELNPGVGPFHVYIGRFLHRLGRLDESREAFEKALAMSPENGLVTTQAITHAIWRGDFNAAQEVIDRTGRRQGALQGRLWNARGNPEPLRVWVAQAIERRVERYVPASSLSNAFYDLGDYDDHMRWFKVQVDELDHLGWIMDDLRRRPDYWDRLQAWALSDSVQLKARLGRINEHRTFVERVTAKMAV